MVDSTVIWNPHASLDRPVKAADIDFGYALALGRAPESEAIREGYLKTSPSVGALLADLLASREFSDAVAAPLATNGLEPERFAAPLGRTGKAWALEVFGPVAVGGAGTWLQLLLQLHASGAVRSLGEAQERIELASAGALPTHQDGALLVKIDGFDGDQVRGWALDLADPDRQLRLELWVDGRFARLLQPDGFRRDLQDRYGGSGRVNFQALLPLRATDSGQPLRLDVRAASGRILATVAGVAGGPVRLDSVASVAAELAAVRAVLERLEHALPDVRARAAFALAGWDDYARTFYPEPLLPHLEQSVGKAGGGETLIEVRVQRGSGRVTELEAALRSLLHQTHPHWTARVAADALDDPGQLDALIESLARPPGCIVVNSDITGTASEDTLIVFMDGDAILAPEALTTFLRVSSVDPQALLLFADDDEVEINSIARRSNPRLKPPLDPYLLLQEDYIGCVYAVHTVLLSAIPVDTALSNHARLLTLVGIAGDGKVSHIPRVLSHHGTQTTTSDPSAVMARLKSLGLHATVEPHSDIVGSPRRGALRLRPNRLDGVRASVILTTRDRLDLLRPCIESLDRFRPANRVNFDLMIVDNGGVEPATAAYLEVIKSRAGVHVIRDPALFNWAAINNRAALKATGEVLIFLNDDTLAISPDWCDELCLWALQPRVGAVGVRLLYDDGTIQHAGVLLGRGGSVRHEAVGDPGGEGGYLGRRQLVHAASAVTGACLATRASVFHQMNGFDAAHFAVTFNDTDYCLRLGEAGLYTLYTPHATFTHLESKSRGFGDPQNVTETDRAHEEFNAFRRRHIRTDSGDRWINPHFEGEAHAFTRLAPPPPLKVGLSGLER